MKSLVTVQKIFRVFQIITKVAMILSFVWAGFAAVGLLLTATCHNSSMIMDRIMESIPGDELAGSYYQVIGVLLADLVLAITDAVLFLMAYRYFTQEQADGTPFTYAGAEQIRKLGIRTIVYPLVAIVLAATFYAVFGVSESEMSDLGNLTSVITGVVMILVSFVFRYGAELEEHAKGTVTEEHKLIQGV